MKLELRIHLARGPTAPYGNVFFPSSKWVSGTNGLLAEVVQGPSEICDQLLAIFDPHRDPDQLVGDSPSSPLSTSTVRMRAKRSVGASSATQVWRALAAIRPPSGNMPCRMHVVCVFPLGGQLSDPLRVLAVALSLAETRRHPHVLGQNAELVSML